MTMVEVTKPIRLGLKLHFLKPMDSTASSALQLESQGEGVKLTWSMDGKNNFMGKLFGLFMNMDEMIGFKYEESLADLKGIAEAEANSMADPKAQAEGQAADEAAKAAQP